jgi:hypothetical protein
MANTPEINTYIVPTLRKVNKELYGSCSFPETMGAGTTMGAVALVADQFAIQKVNNWTTDVAIAAKIVRIDLEAVIEAVRQEVLFRHLDIDLNRLTNKIGEKPKIDFPFYLRTTAKFSLIE